MRGQTVGYYNSLSASFGFQLGVQERSVIILFMTNEALNQFRKTAGWKVGVDGSVAIVTVGAGGSIDTNKITSPVVGFILDPKGLMYNLTLEGARFRAFRADPRAAARVTARPLRSSAKSLRGLVQPAHGAKESVLAFVNWSTPVNPGAVTSY